MNIDIFFGSETGNAQGLAQDAVAFFNDKGHSAHLKDLDGISISDLKSADKVLIITSTWGDGEPPSNATSFNDELQTSSEDLSSVSYAVFAIGSSSFPQFCQAGINIDQKLTELGAIKMTDIVMADDDFSSFSEWLENINNTF